ncbi:MAG: hypothetical protein MI892_30635, partial [Desulfobacterales bacterium]|nr:hypothetical protein [Desulfobacterales bacterium]
IPPYNIYLKSSLEDSTTLVEGTTGTKDNYPDHAPGTYTVVVYDQAKVSDSRQVVISHPDEMTLTHDVTPPECHGDLGIVTLQPNKGTAPFTYELKNTITHKVYSSDGPQFEVPGGTYIGKVEEDNNKCYVTDNSISFDDATKIEINAAGSKIAEYGGNTGTITVNVDGGTPDYTCEVWKGSSKEGSADGGKLEDIVINNLVEGNYEVRVYDKHSCPATKSDVSVEQPTAALSIGIEYENPTTCNGYSDGSFKVTSSGGWEPHTYKFRTGDPQDSPEFTGQKATSGVEYVTVIDKMGVTRTHQVSINQPQSISASLSSTKKLDCYQDNSGTATLNISGGNGGYEIYNNEAWTTDLKATGLSAEPQYIQIKDKLECTGSVLVDLE